MAVYFIGNKEEKVVKIGYSNNIEKRICSLQTSCPFAIEVFCIISNGDIKEEKELHERFSEYRKHGEWFELSDKIQNYIKNNYKNELRRKLETKGEFISSTEGLTVEGSTPFKIIYDIDFYDNNASQASFKIVPYRPEIEYGETTSPMCIAILKRGLNDVFWGTNDEQTWCEFGVEITIFGSLERYSMGYALKKLSSLLLMEDEPEILKIKKEIRELKKKAEINP